MPVIRFAVTAALVVSVASVTGCGRRGADDTVRFSSKDHECMARAMYFESHRSSRDGMVAVGSVVMNRVASAEFPDTVCGVVGQKNQFAPGIMSKPMTENGSLARVEAAAASVLAGERHPRVESARFFHVADYNAGYDNMHYVWTTGGNAFYEKRDARLVTQATPLPNAEGLTDR